ncbi:MAG TPA: FAD-dependent oxidoreductase [Thermoanaerobaculia bacterium]|nr:FAD-dependent oxidoreductase [Thermoanaerobaculia bacterium]
MHPAASDSPSIWIDTAPATEYPALDGDTETDVAIVGAGITGITAAYLLGKEGRHVVLLDKGRIAMAETGHTTAHIVDAADADYRELVKTHGEQNVRLDSEAVRSAVVRIRAFVDELRIDCDFRPVDGYLFTENPDHLDHLKKQLEHLAAAGVEVEWVDDVPLPFSTAGALRYRNQHSFHVRRYLLPLAEAAAALGVRIVENTLATAVENAESDGWCRLTTDRGVIRARHVILASHVPINDRSALWAKMHATRTYVVATPIEPGRAPDALFWDTEDPYHYVRLFETDGRLFLIVGGEDRDVGKEGNDEERYGALETWCRERFGSTEFPWRWSGQINEPADSIPLIGESSHGTNVWMATGYSGTGMTYGTLGAMILADLVLGRTNRFSELYAPGRIRMASMLETIATKAAEMPKRLFDKVTGADVETTTVEEIAEGDGAIVSAGEQKYGVARVDGALQSVDPTCTHMGCTVAWNGAEKSWDCPCHGSRFDLEGKVINGPATTPLERAEYPERHQNR